MTIGLLYKIPQRFPLTMEEIDRIYSLPYMREWHPVYNKEGDVPGFETVRNSTISYRGCAGGCNFCSLSLRQGRIVQSRSIKSLMKEINTITKNKNFRGTITDIGGPTANMYMAACSLWKEMPCAREMQKSEIRL